MNPENFTYSKLCHSKKKKDKNLTLYFKNFLALHRTLKICPAFYYGKIGFCPSYFRNAGCL